MYQTLLTNRYLTSRVIPLIAVGAVALCVALVIVVVSVMTGFLNMVQSAGKTLMGDVIITYGISGIPHYESLVEQLEKDPSVASATPIVDGWGLLRMPYPEVDAKQSETVQVWGIDPVSFAKVTSFSESLQWKTPSKQQRDWILLDAITANASILLESMSEEDQQLLIDTVDGAASRMNFQFTDLWTSMKEQLSNSQWKIITKHDDRLLNPDALLDQGISLFQNGNAGIVSGLHVSEGNERQHDGTYAVLRNDFWWLPRYEGTLTMLPIDSKGGVIEPESIIMPFLNEFKSGVFLVDNSRIFIPIEIAQTLLHLDEAEIVDFEDPTIVIGKDPARATSVLLRGVDGVTADDLQKIAVQVYDDFSTSFQGTTVVFPPPRSDPSLSIHTWKEQQRSFTGPVEKERELMRTLFSIIYLVVAALILSIFWAIVFEKTRDIGILRSLGASRAGIVWIFLRYGAIIGVLGALLGLLLGWLVTKNINEIHSMMGSPPIAIAIVTFTISAASFVIALVRGRRGEMLPIVVGVLAAITFGGIGVGILFVRSIGGVVIWDASVYYFSIIPNNVDWSSASITLVGAVLFCLIGAIIPAAKAADTDPVKALRHE
ncbi:ABC transporter permease [PVC group bacterium]|nr:ABC transporter permease [PVC group bacterium]